MFSIVFTFFLTGLTVQTLMFRSSMRDGLLPIPQTWVHDAWMAFMLVAHAELVPCNGKLVSYRTHPAQQVGPATSTKQKLRRVRCIGLFSFLESSCANNLMEHKKAAVQFDHLAKRLRRLDLQKQQSGETHYR